MISRARAVAISIAFLVGIIVPTGCIRVNGISTQRPSLLLFSENMVQTLTIAIISLIFAWEVRGRGRT